MGEARRASSEKPFILHSGTVGEADGDYVDVRRYESLIAYARGSGFSAIPEGTLDGRNWASIFAVSSATGAAVTVLTSEGAYFIPASGWRWIRIRLLASTNPFFLDAMPNQDAVMTPVVTVTTQDEAYTTLMDDSVTNVLYIGKALPGASTSSGVWQIKKLDLATGIDWKWADGDSKFDNVWDDRLGLTYDY